jgi:tape measure domain-containing protein
MMAEQKVVAELIAKLEYRLDNRSKSRLKEFENNLIRATRRQTDLTRNIRTEASTVKELNKVKDKAARDEERRITRLARNQLRSGTARWNKIKRQEIRDRKMLLRLEKQQAAEEIRQRKEFIRQENKRLGGIPEKGTWAAFNRLRAAAVAATATFGAFQIASSVIQQGQAMNRLQSSLIAIEGSAKDAFHTFQFLTKESQRLGLDIESMADGFINLAASSKGQITKEEVRELFTGFSEYGRAFGVNQFRMEKGLAALAQMAGKGQVMMEELKQQFAEQVPGGMQIFVRATGKTVAEIMELSAKGELLAKDVLPKVAKTMAIMAREGGALERRLKDGDTALGAFSTQWKLMTKTMTDTGMNAAMAALFNSLTSLLEILQPFSSFFGGFSQGFIFAIVEPFHLLADAVYNTFLFIDRAFGTNSRQAVQNFGEEVGKIAGILIGMVALWKGFQFVKRIPRMVADILYVRRIEGATMGGGVSPMGKSGKKGGMGGLAGAFSKKSAMKAGGAALLVGGLATALSSDTVSDFAKNVTSLAAGSAGMALGMKAGAVAGALTGPLAPIAIPALTVIGGAAGGMLGNFAADVAIDGITVVVDGEPLNARIDGAVEARMQTSTKSAQATLPRSMR